jgi:predicted nucleotidyltransferase
MLQVEHSWSSIPEEVQETLRRYVAQLKQHLGTQVEAIVLYGSLARREYVHGRSNINVLLILRIGSLPVLQQCGKLQQKWGKVGIVSPLVITEADLRNSLDLFPLEYFEIKEHHIVLEGRDLFPELHINDRNLSVQCEQEIIGNFLRLRQRFIEGWGRPEAIQALLPISLTTLIPCLKGIYRLLGHSLSGPSGDILDRLSSTLQVDPQAFQEVLSMKRGLSTPGIMDLPKLYERYLRSFQALIDRVRELKAENRI